MKTDIYDLNNYPLSWKNGLYGGAAGSKDGILIENEPWMVKYPKSTTGMQRVDISYTTSPVCEYLGSHVYQILGYPTHDTILGIRHHKLVVACKDFTDANTVLAEIRTIKNYSNELLSEELGVEMNETGETHGVDLEQLMLHIRHNPILVAIPDVEERFFEQVVVDIYINNADRNNGNWGILRHLDGSPDTLAPVFDNGGSFQDKLSDSKAARLLDDIPLAQNYACGTQTAYKDKNGSPYSAQRMLDLYTQYPKLSNAICKVAPLLKQHQSEIDELIDGLPEAILGKDGQRYEVCGPHIKELYKLQLHARYDRIIEKAYIQISKTRDIKDLEHSQSGARSHSHDER